MHELDAILHKIRLVSDADAPKQVGALLRAVAGLVDDEETMAFLEKEAEHLTKVVPCWEEALNSLSLVFSEPLELPEYGQRSLQKLWEIAELRLERLRKISLSIMPQAMPHVYGISNLDKNQMKTQLGTLANDVGISLDLPKTLEFAHIREAVRELQQFIEHLDPSYSDERLCSARHALEAFFGVTLQYYAEQSDKAIWKQKIQEACAGFVYCDKCWRLLPKELFADGQLPLCDEHNYSADKQGSYTRYKKAALVKKGLDEESLFIPQRVCQVLQELKQVWHVEYGHIAPAIWDRAFMDGFNELFDAAPETIQYDLAPVWEICPHVRQYIIEHSGNIESPESIVEILDPFSQYELQTGYTEPRTQLHKAFALNFSYYRLELAAAEAWLEHYSLQNHDKQHGGARRNSGGKRAGAGRPRKKMR